MRLLELEDERIFIFKEKRFSPFKGQIFLNNGPPYIVLHSDNSHWIRMSYFLDDIVKMRVK